MALNDISLTAGMRNNLLALQNTSTLLNRTQERLSTGKKVNSALDNPTNFFAAQVNNNRASDLSSRKDGMSEAVQTIKAADNGITSITSLIEAAKGIANAAVASTVTSERTQYQTTFNEINNQISQLATNSDYRGTNFLKSGTLQVEFSPTTGAQTLTITGFDATSTGLGITNAVAWAGTGAAATAAIKSASTLLETAQTTLRNKSADLSANLTVITSRQSFTDNMINTLTTGSDNLTLADTNAEGANMLMLQTRQSLGVTSLSLASQAAQSVLRLF